MTINLHYVLAFLVNQNTRLTGSITHESLDDSGYRKNNPFTERSFQKNLPDVLVPCEAPPSLSFSTSFSFSTSSFFFTSFSSSFSLSTTSLSALSSENIVSFSLGGVAGTEPVTSAFERCSQPLSYRRTQYVAHFKADTTLTLIIK